MFALSIVRAYLFFFPSAEKITVVSAIAVHARINAQKDQLQDESLEWAAPSMTVYIEAATLGALANRRPRVPHAPRC
jgi:hypothetical protein